MAPYQDAHDDDSTITFRAPVVPAFSFCYCILLPLRRRDKFGPPFPDQARAAGLLGEVLLRLLS